MKPGQTAKLSPGKREKREPKRDKRTEERKGREASPPALGISVSDGVTTKERLS